MLDIRRLPNSWIFLSVSVCDELPPRPPGEVFHIGLVVSVNPLRIIHASSAAGCVTTDTKLGKWAYWGWLKDVARDGITHEPEKGDEEPVTAVVFAESGSTVNMRVRANASAALVERVPILPEPKGGIGRADHLSRLEVHGNDCYPRNQA